MITPYDQHQRLLPPMRNPADRQSPRNPPARRRSIIKPPRNPRTAAASQRGNAQNRPRHAHQNRRRNSPPHAPPRTPTPQHPPRKQLASVEVARLGGDNAKCLKRSRDCKHQPVKNRRKTISVISGMITQVRDVRTGKGNKDDTFG